MFGLQPLKAEPQKMFGGSNTSSWRVWMFRTRLESIRNPTSLGILIIVYSPTPNNQESPWNSGPNSQLLQEFMTLFQRRLVSNRSILPFRLSTGRRRKRRSCMLLWGEILLVVISELGNYLITRQNLGSRDERLSTFSELHCLRHVDAVNSRG